MINLIKADLYKEFKKRSFIITCFLVTILTIVYLFILYKNINLDKEYITLNPVFTENEYRQIYNNGNYDYYLEKYEKYKTQVTLQNEATILNNNNKSKILIENITSLLYLVGVIIIFKSFHSLSYDFQNKSIRYVFQSNHKRTTILLSKFFSLIIITTIYILLILFTMLITTYLLTGENILFFNHVIVYNDELIKLPFLLYILIICLVYLFPLIFIISYTLFICILLKGNSIVLIINTVIYLLGLTVSNLAIKYDFKFIEYTFLPYLDFTYFKDNANVILQNIIYNINLNLFNGIILLIVYACTFFLLSCILIKRDT